MRLQLRLAKGLDDFFADETAATAIEYALIASIVSIAILSSVTTIGSTLRDVFFNGINDGFASVNGD
ncbi:MAG: Flp family type IVb pilin [Bradyrhizobiaceae bacterium]|nr:Flp family type IVb pilin [Bradyrhizobiaceae bacterium]